MPTLPAGMVRLGMGDCSGFRQVMSGRQREPRRRLFDPPLPGGGGRRSLTGGGKGGARLTGHRLPPPPSPSAPPPPGGGGFWKGRQCQIADLQRAFANGLRSSPARGRWQAQPDGGGGYGSLNLRGLPYRPLRRLRRHLPLAGGGFWKGRRRQIADLQRAFANGLQSSPARGRWQAQPDGGGGYEPLDLRWHRLPPPPSPSAPPPPGGGGF